MTGDSRGEPGGPRYAVYFAPPRDSALHRFGSRWLGRDAESGEALAQPAVNGITPERLIEITAFPRRYGFHATLKAPFRLAVGADAAALSDAIAGLVSSCAPFAAPPLRPATLDGWRALVLAEPCPRMQALCDELVAGLDHLRAPPSAAEAERRLAGPGARQRALYARWGYPHVFDAFVFHMTLTSPLEAEEGRRVDAALAPLVAGFAEAPLEVGEVAVFVQPDEGARFTLARRFPFGGAGAARAGDAA